MRLVLLSADVLIEYRIVQTVLATQRVIPIERSLMKLCHALQSVKHALVDRGCSNFEKFTMNGSAAVLATVENLIRFAAHPNAAAHRRA
ncbi:MAG TPA: hypothetical protein VJO35_06455 [Terriglobales bacterium]|nr:hypothetical protein [Terriglobales bacterium]